MIDPTAVSTIRVGELPSAPFNLTDNIPHEVGVELKKGTIEELSTFISAYIGATDAVGFRAISVTDGQTLPTTTKEEFILVGKGTFYNVAGGSTIVCTEELNAIVSNGSFWFIGVEIPVNIELSGVTQFIRQGFTDTTPSEDVVYDALALKVPYTGATTNVSLGEFQLSAGQITFDQTPTQTAGVGVLRWNDTDGTLDLGLKGGNVTLQLGQEQIVRVVNKTGSNLTEAGYQAVYTSGAQGQRLKVDLALANSDLTSAGTLGLITENILVNQEGFVTTNGLVRGINTTGSLQSETWADGDILYLSPITAGKLTNIKPTAPQHSVTIGVCVYAHITQGAIFVKVDNGYELEELHNVLINTAINNDALIYESATGLWKNKTISSALGYTPENVANKSDSYTVSSSTTYASTKALVDGLAIKENKQSYIVYADDYANLTLAINATPQGGTLLLGNHTYTGNMSISRDNISIEGTSMPSFHPSTDSLLGGSIINGTFIIDGSNVSLRNLGIDCGTAQCVALNGGAPMEGLVLHDISAVALNVNNRVENVISIVKPSTTMHAILLEGLTNSYFNNVHGKGGAFGVVMKVSDSNASNIFGYETTTTNVYIKSDSYAPCLRSNFNNIYSISNVIFSTQPVAIHASTFNLFDVNVNNVNIYGGVRQFRLIASPSATPTYVMTNVNVSNVIMENGTDVGLDTYGVIYNSAFSNVLVRNTISGQGLFSDASSRGINFNNIRFDDNSGNDLDTAIDFRGGCIVNNVVSIKNTDQTNFGGINFNGNIGGFKIGEYIGNLKVNTVSVNKNKITGQGTANYLSKYNTAGEIKNSLFYEDGLNSSFNTSSPYSLGAGWSLFSANNSTGSGFVTQVNNVSALRITSSATTTNIAELRNLPILITTNATERFRVHASGGVSIGNTVDPSVNNLSITGTTLSSQYRLSALNTAPATATSTGTLGEIRVTATHIYVCTATNTWVRTALATW